MAGLADLFAPPEVDPRDFIGSQTAAHKQKQRDAMRQAAYLENLPNPSGQVLTNPEPSRPAAIGTILSRAMEGLGMPSRLAADYGGYGETAAEMSPVTALDALDRGDPTEIANELAMAVIPATKVVKSAKHPLSKIVMKTPLSEVKPTYEDAGEMLPEKLIHPESLLGHNILPVRGDPTITGKRLTGVGGKLFDKAVDLPGGPGFMRGPQQVAEGMGWASNQGPSTILSKTAAELTAANDAPTSGVYMKMAPHSGDYAVHMGQTVREMFKLNPPPQKAVDSFDEAMRRDWGAPNKKGVVPYPATTDWPGMQNITDEWLVAHPNDRKKMVKMLDAKTWRDMGFPEIGNARYATTEPDLVDTPTNSSGYGVVQFDPSGATTLDPKIPHPTYAQQNKASYTGRLPEIPLDVLYKDYSLIGKNGGPIPNSELTKFLETKPPRIIKMDHETLDRVMTYLRSQDGAKWGLGGAIAAGVMSQEQGDEVKRQLQEGS